MRKDSTSLRMPELISSPYEVRMSEKEEKVVFGGRLGEYKYYDMDQVIASALDMCRKELG